MRRARPSLKLKKTLDRRLDYRPIEGEDVSYAWAAYRSGALPNVFPDGLGAQEFKTAFEDLVISRYDAAWTLFADTKKGFIPVGLMVGFWPHHETTQFMIADAFIWFPWASPRNRIESAVNFLNSIRGEIPMLGFAREKDKNIMEMIARHGILRRIGTSMNAFAGERAATWETRA